MKIELKKVQDFQLNPIPHSDWAVLKGPDYAALVTHCRSLYLCHVSKCQAVNCPLAWLVSPRGLGSRLVCCSCFSSGSQYWSSSRSAQSAAKPGLSSLVVKSSTISLLYLCLTTCNSHNLSFVWSINGETRVQIIQNFCCYMIFDL